MNQNLPKLIRWAAVSAAAAISVCVLLLTGSYIMARIQAPRDEKIVAELKVKVKQDASFAPKLEAQHKRITAALQERKKRDGIIAIILLVVASLFVASAKWLVALDGRHPLPMERLVQLKAEPRSTPVFTSPVTSNSEEEFSLLFVDRIVQRHGTAKEAAIPILQAIQEKYRYLPDEALKRVCELTEITPAQIAGTSSFYAQFRRSPLGKHVVRVCHGTACHVAGARQLTDELRRRLEIPDGADTDAQRMFTVDEVACVGCCSLAPVMMVDGQAVGKLSPTSACEALDSIRSTNLT